MNKRIRELALQANLGPALLLHHWGTIDALTDSERDELNQMEKFAKLIIHECATLKLDPIQIDEAQYYHGWLDYRDEIFEHFKDEA